MGEAARIGSFSQGYVLKNFSEITIEDNKIRGVARYDEEVFGYTATDEEYSMLGSLGGTKDLIDMSTELAASAAILNIRSIEPQDALKIYTEIAMEGAVNSFLGTTGATHTGVLSRLKAKYNFTDRQIRGAIENAVHSEVDAQFNRISFRLDRHNAILSHNPKTGEYTLSYGGVNTNNETRNITANSLQALSSEMLSGRNKTDFTSADLNTLRAQAALIPAVVFDGWRKSTWNMVDPYELLAKALTDFYTTPNRTNYEVICGIQARAMLAVIADDDTFTDAMDGAIGNTIASLSTGLYEKMAKDLRQNGAIMAASSKPNDPRYSIFTLTKATGDEIFVSKKMRADGLLESR
jgi:hypothetical protein